MQAACLLCLATKDNVLKASCWLCMRQAGAWRSTAHLVVTVSGAVTVTSCRSNVTENRVFSAWIMNWYPSRSVKREMGSSNTMSLA